MRDVAEVLAGAIVGAVLCALVLVWVALYQHADSIDRQEVALSALYARVDSLEAVYRGGE